MKYKAVVSLCGKISMARGDVKEIEDKEIVKDLLKAGYIVEVPEEKKKAKTK